MQIIKFTKYDKYKPSGVKWLGKIPEHWNVLPGSSVFEERSEKNIGFKENTVLSLSYGNIIIKPEEKLTGLVPESFETYQVVYPGDIIIRPTDLQNDKVSLRTGLAKNKGIITSAYLNFKLKNNYSSSFYHYFLHTIDITKIIYGLGSGLRQNLNFNDFKRFKFFVPPLPEQTAIANFLDRKTGLIDKAIAIKEKQIELLKERRQIIIHNAVTRGLNPNVKMKASGVDWIGEIPEHWEVKRLRYLANCFPSNIDKHSRINEVGVRLCNYTDVYKNDFITNDMDLMQATATKEQIDKFTLLKADVVITKDSESANDIAVPAFIKENLTNVVCGYHLAVIRPNSDIYGMYLFRAFQCKLFNVQFELYSNGITRVGLGTSDLKKGQFLLPPFDEQQKISEFIEIQTGKIDKAISIVEQVIGKLKEYKSTLIDSAVTGKIKVC